MRKIPLGAEASNVLVGEVDFLNYQFSTFVRLSKPVLLGDFTEVPVPTRFIFIILGPKGNITKYHEIGRSISTLMSDEVISITSPPITFIYLLKFKIKQKKSYFTMSPTRPKTNRKF
jgi:hypothetical protein